MDDAAEADFFGSAGDGVVNLADPHQLECLHPVAQVVEHEDEVVVVFEGLAFHAWNRFKFILRVGGFIHELADLIVHESGELEVEVRIRFANRFENPAQFVIIELGQFREAVVGQKIGKLLRLTCVVLLVHWDCFATNQKRGLQAAMPANDQPGALGYGDGIAPTLLLDDRREKLDLVGAVAVWVNRVGFQRVGIQEAGVGAMHGNAHAPCPAVNYRPRTLDTAQAFIRSQGRKLNGLNSTRTTIVARRKK